MFTSPSHGNENRSVVRRLGGGLALFGAVVLAGVLALAAPASARPSGPAGNSDVLILPAVPRATGTVSTLAVSPTISPAARQVRHVAAGKPATCASGNLCTFVWDPTTSSWKVFDLYTCAKYSLYNWLGDGFYNNAQTGGATVTFYGQSSNVLNSFTGTGTGSQDWDPVWYIRNC